MVLPQQLDAVVKHVCSVLLGRGTVGHCNEAFEYSTQQSVLPDACGQETPRVALYVTPFLAMG